MSAQEPALSERIRHVLALVSVHKAVADVGCDHGYMAIELIRSGKAKHVIAMDIKEGPLARAEENRKAYGLCDVIETRRGDGMEAICRGEVQAVICAGMGGKTICGIIERSRLLARELDEMILQPQSELHIVRGYLRENGFSIAAEDMVLEDGKFYPMMRVIPANGGNPDAAEAGKAEGMCVAEAGKAGAVCDAESGKADGTEANAACNAQAGKADDTQAEIRQRVEDWYGPCLLADAHPVLMKYLQKEKTVYEAVLRNLSHASSEGGKARREELMQRISDIEFAEGICRRNTE